MAASPGVCLPVIAFNAADPYTAKVHDVQLECLLDVAKEVAKEDSTIFALLCKPDRAALHNGM